ncbi:MAG: amidohydrolase family protein [Alphaproteobacteria bacterium]|nr:amidohydrolase family protein [Alphaproteobacteria bacterium]
MQAKQKWTNVSIVTPHGVVRKDLAVEGDRISTLIEPGTSTGSDWETKDGGGRIVFPGMLDILQHGFDVNFYHEPTPGCVASSSALLPAHGVTGFLPSIGSLPPGEIIGVLADLAGQCGEAKGARALGVHSEGPCFGAPGAHNPKNLQLPTLALADEMLKATGGKLSAVTIAPELEGAEAFIKLMKQSGVSVHLGHSQALADNVSRYVSWGIDAVTHMYNVTRALPPDDSGVHVFSLPDALLAEPDLALGLICDGIHVHPKLVALLAQLPPSRLFLETDSIKYAGRDGARFEAWPGYWVTSEKGNAVKDDNGGLCGSSLTSHEAMLNFIEFTGADLTRAAIASALIPARIIGRDRDMGSIEPGKLADFTLLDPETLAVTATYVGGRPVFERAP